MPVKKSSALRPALEGTSDERWRRAFGGTCECGSASRRTMSIPHAEPDRGICRSVPWLRGSSAGSVAQQNPVWPFAASRYASAVDLNAFMCGRASASACAPGPQPRSATGPGGATTFASSSAVRSTSSRCSGSSRRRPQAALSRSYIKRKNQCGAGMAATLRVRLLAGAGANPDARAAEVDDLGRRTASPAVTLVLHVHALAAPHALMGLPSSAGSTAPDQALGRSLDSLPLLRPLELRRAA